MYKGESKEEVAPVITDYMSRIYLAGYGEGYMRNILEHVLIILDTIYNTGTRPGYNVYKNV